MAPSQSSSTPLQTSAVGKASPVHTPNVPLMQNCEPPWQAQG